MSVWTLYALSSLTIPSFRRCGGRKWTELRIENDKFAFSPVASLGSLHCWLRLCVHNDILFDEVHYFFSKPFL